MEPPAHADAVRVLAACGVPEEPLERVHSYSSAVFVGPRHVVRLQPPELRWMLDHEARVLAALPAEVPHAEVVGVGSEERFMWLVLRRLPGEQLGRCWPHLTPADRQAAVEQLGAALRHLHAEPDPARFRHPTVEAPDHSTYQQHPSRVDVLVAAGRELPEVDVRLLDDVEAFVTDRLDAFDGDDTRPALVHADLHFENLLWDRASRRLTAVLDFEWSRPAAPDLDVNVILRMCGDPALLVAEDYEATMRPQDFTDVPRWLAGAYPELFAHPRLLERQEAYAAMYDLRAVLAYWRVPWHRPWPVDELRDLLAGTSFVTGLLARVR